MKKKLKLTLELSVILLTAIVLLKNHIPKQKWNTRNVRNARQDKDQADITNFLNVYSEVVVESVTCVLIITEMWKQ